MLSMRDVTVSTCMKWAYKVQQAQIVPKKDMDSVHYDMVAKLQMDEQPSRCGLCSRTYCRNVSV